MDFECFMHFYEGLHVFATVFFVTLDLFLTVFEPFLTLYRGPCRATFGPNGTKIGSFWGIFGLFLGSIRDHFENT